MAAHATCRRRMVRRTGLLACVAVLSAYSALAQDATEPALKSALVFNFAKFTNWPQDALPRNAELVACVIGSHDVGQALERAVKNRMLDGHPIIVSDRGVGDARPSFRTCHLLYITGRDARLFEGLLTELRGTPILTIVDVDDPSTADGIVALFVENGRVRFQIDNGLARQGRLEISSRLLSLASGVQDAGRRDAPGGAR
jgi:hypothetical protein